jgi:hypothetical protein
MEKWRELAIQFFPDGASIYRDENETVWSVHFDAHDAVVEAHRNNNLELLQSIYAFAEWCHSQKDVEPDLWTAAWAAFYEHLVEHEETYRAIPRWLKPDIFRDMLSEFQDRLDNKLKYPGQTPGTFRELLELYDEANDTKFVEEWENQGKQTE